MKTFYGEDLFLQTDTAKALYSRVKALPIYDYHCHMTAKDIFEDVINKHKTFFSSLNDF